MNKVKDYPGVVTALAVFAVFAHWVLVRQTSVPALPAKLVFADSAASLYLSAAGVVAVLAGFSGVIIVFALSPGVAALEKMRDEGGDRLRANWVSLVSNPVSAALLYLFAGTLATTGKPRAGGWLFELAATLTVLGALRMMWLFRRLAHKDLSPRQEKKASALELVQEAQRRGAAGGS